MSFKQAPVISFLITDPVRIPIFIPTIECDFQLRTSVLLLSRGRHWSAHAGDGGGATVGWGGVIEILELGMLFGVFSEFCDGEIL